MTTANVLEKAADKGAHTPTVLPGEEVSGNSIAILNKARERAAELNLPFAGGVTPNEAWALFRHGDAILVDIRSAEERKFVGHVPGTLHVAWATGTSLTRNPRFLRELEAKTGKTPIVLLLCRSGKRSALAAEAAAKTGFTNVFNVLEGFEGDHNEQQQRGSHNGWRFWNLPWVQD
ncbi:rhodanese-like domain-containing protein [Uliginosibacterium gangwonense]|uniref:rhodanese-like domain-containing protein n=1 Tax=Uliginosibacterium gangwonense TaxID=392736 RepID=UPI00035F963A|nr:rhodanese-like domain-containing protein [Uliginosibacterium gangwonense]